MTTIRDPDTGRDSKQKTLVLGYFQPKPFGQYEVKTVINSLDFHPGNWLNKNDLAALVADPTWTIQVDTVNIPYIPLPTAAGKLKKFKKNRKAKKAKKNKLAFPDTGV